MQGDVYESDKQLELEKNPLRQVVLDLVKYRLGPIIGLVVIWLFFAILAGKDFRAISNQQLILLQTVVVGTAAVGATMIIISGGIDLSIGATIALTTMVVALVVDKGLPIWVACLCGMATGVLVGLTIGALVAGYVGRVAGVVMGVLLGMWAATHLTWFGGVAVGLVTCAIFILLNEKFIRIVPISSFIVTLGLWGAVRGVAKWVGGNEPIYPDDLGWVGDLMVGIPLGKSGWSFPAPGVWILIVSAIVMSFILSYTQFGRHVFAIGSNERTALLCGIKIRRTQIKVYMLAILFGGIAGILQTSFLSMGDPTTADGYELQVIAAVVIGGASLLGGEGSVLGTIVGALIMTVVANGCTKLGLDNYVQQIVTGAIIVLAVGLDQWRHGAKYAR
ncbi:ABC transporter permease [Poriferisphaera sp. WC338]|uniref:ABC transporter permease n=1 Tax=Poriferisphaera sp. WC338 TaxID=3425129 RepID=UPI003D815D9C